MPLSLLWAGDPGGILGGEQEMAHFAVILVTLLPPLVCGAVVVQTASLLTLGIEWFRGVLGA